MLGIGDLRFAGMNIESGRLSRGKAAFNMGQVIRRSDTEARVGQYDVKLDDTGSALDVDCTCIDWRVRGRNATPKTPCKHMLAFAVANDAAKRKNKTASKSAAQPQEKKPTRRRRKAKATAAGDFQARVSAKIGEAVHDLAVQIFAALGRAPRHQWRPPLLLGPTGTGKSTAVQQLAVDQGWGLERVPGTPSWADADLVGLKLRSGDVPGPVTRAMRRARDGETVLLFMDEFYQLSDRAQALGLHLFQPVPASVAQAMGIDTNVPVYRVETPLWGVEWAPVSNLKIVAAANPWGQIPSPALMRRTLLVPVTFSEKPLEAFGREIATAARLSWSAVQDGTIPLPLEYGLLASAKSPDDKGVLREYLTMLTALDEAAGQGFRQILKGQGVKV